MNDERPTGKRTRGHGLVVLTLGLVVSAVHGQAREDVLFQITYEPPIPDASAFVLGDLPELGGGDITKAVKLVEKESFLWEVTVSLPVNRTYTYQYYGRAHGRNVICNPANGVPIGDPITASTSTVPLCPVAKKIYYHSTIDPPTLHWRQEGDPAPYETLVMQEIGPGRAIVPGEMRWFASDFGAARRPIEFYLTNADETLRDPDDPAETYLTPLDAFFLQDNHLFTYVPAPTVSPQQRDYDPDNPLSISTNDLLPEENRLYRVMLPRGYDEHTDRHYPVMYYHDGHVVWESASSTGQVCPVLPCAHDLDGATAAELTRLGQMREMIMVAIDVPGADGCERLRNRIRDYVPTGDSVTYGGCELANGAAENYVAFIIQLLKPHIDATYRTLPGPAHTGTAGFSAGGMVSLFLGWDYTDTFARAGVMSGDISLLTNNFFPRVLAEPWREFRMYQDFGTLEGAGLYDGDLVLRDNLLGKSPEHWVVEGDHRYFVACGQSHTIPEAATRQPNMLTFLFPGTEEPNQLLCAADLDCDGTVGITDFLDLLAAWGPNPGHPADLDGDGIVGITDFLALLAAWGPCP